MLVSSWAAVEAALCNAYPTDASASDTEVQVSVTVGEQTAVVRCCRLDPGGAQWLAVMVEVLPMAGVAPDAAMHLNFEFTTGSLCTYRDTLHMRQTLPMQNVTSAALLEVVEALVSQIESVRELVTKPPSDNAGVYVNE